MGTNLVSMRRHLESVARDSSNSPMDRGAIYSAEGKLAVIKDVLNGNESVSSDKVFITFLVTMASNDGQFSGDGGKILPRAGV